MTITIDDNYFNRVCSADAISQMLDAKGWDREQSFSPEAILVRYNLGSTEVYLTVYLDLGVAAGAEMDDGWHTVYWTVEDVVGLPNPVEALEAVLDGWHNSQ